MQRRYMTEGAGFSFMAALLMAALAFKHSGGPAEASPRLEEVHSRGIDVGDGAQIDGDEADGRAACFRIAKRALLVLVQRLAHLCQGLMVGTLSGGLQFDFSFACSASRICARGRDSFLG